jgi:hypothetical protein
VRGAGGRIAPVYSGRVVNGHPPRERAEIEEENVRELGGSVR